MIKGGIIGGTIFGLVIVIIPACGKRGDLGRRVSVVHVALRPAERSADRAPHVAAHVTAPAPHGRVARGGRDLTLVLVVVEVLAGRVNGVDEGPLRI